MKSLTLWNIIRSWKLIRIVLKRSVCHAQTSWMSFFRSFVFFCFTLHVLHSIWISWTQMFTFTKDHVNSLGAAMKCGQRCSQKKTKTNEKSTECGKRYANHTSSTCTGNANLFSNRLIIIPVARCAKLSSKYVRKRKYTRVHAQRVRKITTFIPINEWEKSNQPEHKRTNERSEIYLKAKIQWRLVILC